MATPNFWHIQRRRKRTSGDLLDENSHDGKPKHGFVTPMRYQQKIKPIPMEFSELWIGGYLVKLPLNMVPYTTQRTMMAKILKSLKNRLNALIESPTGSGKTLGLLSATCAWLVKYKEEREQSRKECPICNSSKHITESTAPSTNQENSNDAWSVNGSENPSSCENTNTENSLDSANIVNKKPLLTLEEEFDADFRASPSPAVTRRKSLISEDSKRLKLENGEETEKKVTESHTCLPRVTIYYGTRTHKQISQVVSEFARLPYGHDDRIRHTILASRDHSCINLAVRNSGDVNASCKELISSRGVGCAYKNAMRGKYEKAQPLRRLVSKGMQGSSNVWDIEDLVEALKVSNPTLCPYFSSTRVLTQDADIVFCPFTYMIDPIIRDNSEVTLKNAIVILDEAHNVEDVCREAVSFSFTEKEIVAACADFGKKELQQNFDLLIAAADVEKALNKSKRKQTAQEGLDNVDGWKTEQTSDALNNLSTNYGTVNKFMSDLLDWFVGMSAEVLNKTVGRDDRQSETFSWERLYTSFEESKLTVFGEKGKSSAYSSLLVRHYFLYVTFD
ncbi:unnamed protein product [Anisakis simplex]|uniref:Fanconi anemia group J protein (inferred by orthology to a human protein) n=1 Tax=Anisakis simplex TaxID=6269 RepID=A0A0M3KB88_ANISI|nr:unnamed protein product [Anisakis simplex]